MTLNQDFRSRSFYRKFARSLHACLYASNGLNPPGCDPPLAHWQLGLAWLMAVVPDLFWLAAPFWHHRFLANTFLKIFDTLRSTCRNMITTVIQDSIHNHKEIIRPFGWPHLNSRRPHVGSRPQCWKTVVYGTNVLWSYISWKQCFSPRSIEQWWWEAYS